MSWELRVRGRAKSELARFPKKDKERVLSALGELKFNPYSGDIEKIEGEENTWRRRVGNYRLVYDVDVQNKIVAVRNIKRRTSSTY